MMPVTVGETTHYTTREVAARTGQAIPTITRKARVHKIGKRIGRDWIFTDADIEAIQAIDPLGGRPPSDGGEVKHTKSADSVKKGRPPRKS